MPSDGALRVSLVCTLPLLHFSPSLVAVGTVDLERSLASLEAVVHPSSSAPAFCRALPLTWSPRQVRVTPAVLTIPASSPVDVPTGPFYRRAPGELLRSTRKTRLAWVCSQPPRISAALARPPGLPSSVLELPPRSRGPAPFHSQRPAPPFPVKPLFTLTVLVQAAGPVLQKGQDSLLRSGLRSPLCSFFTVYRLSRRSHSSALRLVIDAASSHPPGRGRLPVRRNRTHLSRL